VVSDVGCGRRRATFQGASSIGSRQPPPVGTTGPCTFFGIVAGMRVAGSAAIDIVASEALRDRLPAGAICGQGPISE
jgi:hypothetical protein